MPEDMVPSAEQFIDYFGDMANSLKEAKAIIAQAEHERAEMEVRRTQLASLMDDVQRVNEELNRLRQMHHDAGNAWVRYEKQIHDLRTGVERQHEEAQRRLAVVQQQVTDEETRLAALTEQQVQDAKTRIAEETDLAQRALASLQTEILKLKGEARDYAYRLGAITNKLDALCGA